MKKKFLIVTLIGISSLMFSQNTNQYKKENMSEQKREEKAKIYKEKMAKELNLTEEQVKQINSIDEKYKPQEEAIRKQVHSAYDEKKELKMQKRAEVEKILTEEQKAKLKELKSKYRENKEKM